MKAKKNEYIKPNMSITAVPCSMLSSSIYKDHPCNNYCKFWHICRDREWGKICEDFRYKEL